MEDLNQALRLIASKISIDNEGEYQLKGDLCRALVDNAAESALIIGAFTDIYGQKDFTDPPEIQ
jgi:hypothetical protein